MNLYLLSDLIVNLYLLRIYLLFAKDCIYIIFHFYSLSVKEVIIPISQMGMMLRDVKVVRDRAEIQNQHWLEMSPWLISGFCIIGDLCSLLYTLFVLSKFSTMSLYYFYENITFINKYINTYYIHAYIYTTSDSKALWWAQGGESRKNSLEGNKGKPPLSNWYPFRSEQPEQNLPKEAERSFALSLDLITVLHLYLRKVL